MALSKNNKGFSLDLIVGIDDIFKKQAKDVEKEATSLEKHFKKLQSTLADIDEFKKLQKDLKQLEGQTDATEEQIKSLTDRVESSKMSLHSAGVSTSKLADEQKRLATSLAKTSKEMKDQEKQVESMRTAQERFEALAVGAATAATVGVLAHKLVSAGSDRDKMIRMAASSTNASYEDLSSNDAKRWRSKMIRQMGGDHEYADVMAAQALALETGASDEEAKSLAENSLNLTKFNKDWSLEEVNYALNKMVQSDDDLSFDRAAAILDAVRKNGGKEYKDVLDSALEYSGYLSDIGMDTETAWAAAMASIKGGARGTDKAFDALKEGISARLSDPSEVENLLGKGTTEGILNEYIDDEDVRQQIKNSLGAYITALGNGDNTAMEIQGISKALTNLYEKDPQNAKIVTEGIFGVQGSEDLTKGGLKNFLDVLSGNVSPDEILKTQRSLEESVALSQSATDNLGASWSLFLDPFVNLASDMMNSTKGATEVIKNGASAWSDTLNDNSLVTGALATGAIVGGTALAFKKLSWAKALKDRGKDFALKALTGGGAGLVDDAADVSKEALKKGGLADDAVKSAASVAGEATQAAKGSSILKIGANAIGSVAKSAGSYLGSFAKKLPVIGAVLNTGMIGLHASEGDYESVFGDIGSILGGLAGGVAGTFAMPGVGTAAGGVGGSMLGNEGGRALYRWLFGDDETTEPLQPQLAKVEEVVASISQTSSPTNSTSKENAAIQVSVQNSFSFDLGIVNGEDESAQDMLIQALRMATPEMQRQLKATLEELFESNDNIAISDY